MIGTSVGALAALLPRGSRTLSTSSSHMARKWKYHSSRDLVPPPKSHNEVMPERPRLPIMTKSPTMWASGASRPPKGTKELWRLMGEERVHTELTLGQFGIVALAGGMLRHKHFEVMRMALGRHCDANKNKTFAMYRVDAPYKPITDHGTGKRMGGGKGNIDEYGTPVRAGRVVVEVGGAKEWAEVRPWLAVVARQLPFHAIAVTAEMLHKLKEEEQRLVAANQNPYTFEWMVRNNILNCQTMLSDYDKRWFGKFCYKDRETNLKWQRVLGGYTRANGQNN